MTVGIRRPFVLVAGPVYVQRAGLGASAVMLRRDGCLSTPVVKRTPIAMNAGPGRVPSRSHEPHTCFGGPRRTSCTRWNTRA